MSRATRHGPFVHPKLWKKVIAAQNNQDRVVIKTWARSSTILPEMVGMTIAVHDGRRHIPVLCSENMVGHKLGEFAFTRTYRGHRGKSERTSQRV